MKPNSNPFEYVPLAGYTIQEWCHRWRISQPQYFKIQNEGTGPRVTRIGRRVIITTEADESWSREREAAATQPRIVEVA